MHARETPVERRNFRALALAIVVAIVPLLLLVARTGGKDGFVELGQVAATSVLFLGKFVIFLGWTDDRIFGPLALALLCVTIDLFFAVGLGSGLERLERAPLIGRGLRAARLRAMRVVTRYPGLEGIAFFGVVGFVLLPLAATGAVSGSFAGRFLGLSRAQTVVAVGCGSLGTSVTFASLALILGERAEQLARSPLLVAGTVVLLIVLGRIGYGKVTRHLRQARGPRREPPEDADSPVSSSPR